MTAITANEQLLYTKNEHNHEIIPGHIEAKQNVGKMKKTTRTEQNPVNNTIIASNLRPIGSDIVTQMSLPTQSATNWRLNGQKVRENKKAIHYRQTARYSGTISIILSV